MDFRFMSDVIVLRHTTARTWKPTAPLAMKRKRMEAWWIEMTQGNVKRR